MPRSSPPEVPLAVDNSAAETELRQWHPIRGALPGDAIGAGAMARSSKLGHTSTGRHCPLAGDHDVANAANVGRACSTAAVR